jgi:hypothetical protein
MIFPGMDPYLEDPLIWQGFHNRFVVHLADALNPLVRPRYITSVEERVFVEGPEPREILPDVWLTQTKSRAAGGSDAAAVATLEMDEPELVKLSELEVHENYIEILDRQSGLAVVTVIEVLSPTNKFSGPGRDLYLAKHLEVRHRRSHLVEIDLLRTGPHVLVIPERAARARGSYDYLVCVNRAIGVRGEYELYKRRVRQRLPVIHIPLANGDPDVPLDLQAVLAHTFEAGSYRDRLPYDRECLPPLDAEDQQWANDVVRQANQANGSKLSDESNANS